MPFSGILGQKWNSKTLDAKMSGVNGHWKLYFRALWSYALIYNRLPDGIVMSETVSAFQAKLNHLAQVRAQSNDPKWRESFQSGGDVLQFFYGSAN